MLKSRREIFAQIYESHRISSNRRAVSALALVTPNCVSTRCIDFSKKMAKIEFLLENDDGTWRVIFDSHIVPELLFRKMYPPHPVLPESVDPKGGNPYGELGAMSNITRVWAFAGECLTMEATLPPTKSFDCGGHFYNTPTLPHSIMVFHNCGTSSLFTFTWTGGSISHVYIFIFAFADLIGQALSEFADVDLPFKRSDFGQDHGMKILSWTVRYCLWVACCLPSVALH